MFGPFDDKPSGWKGSKTRQYDVRAEHYRPYDGQIRVLPPREIVASSHRPLCDLRICFFPRTNVVLAGG